jgi:hypothetical protein
MFSDNISLKSVAAAAAAGDDDGDGDVLMIM